MMAQDAGKQQNTAYGVFVQACWAQHKRQYPDELIHKEIEEFNKQCSVWWYNLSEQERDRFQEMADRSNSAMAYSNAVMQQQSQTSAAAMSFGAAASSNAFGGYDAYGLQPQGGVVNVIDNSGAILNYSTNAVSSGHMLQQQVQHHPQQVQVQQQHHAPAKRPPAQSGSRAPAAAPAPAPPTSGKGSRKALRDPNAPKKPLSIYFHFSQEERLKVKAEYPDYSITEVAKEIGRRWATLDPVTKASYKQRYQDAWSQYETALHAYKPQKKKRKDPGAPKQPLPPYFIFSSEERLKVKAENPSFSICQVAKELGRRWSEMPPEVKQRYQQMAEKGRQKYDQEMAVFRQSGAAGGPAGEAGAAAEARPEAATVAAVATAGQQSYNDYGRELLL